MIEITNIFAGWLTFQIHYGHSISQFTVSYLDDFRYAMDYLLGINRDGNNQDFIYDFECGIESRAITLDGEGTLLKLGIIKYEYDNEIALTWWLNDEVPINMVFNYDDLVHNYLTEMNRIGDEAYKRDFLMEYEENEDEK